MEAAAAQSARADADGTSLTQAHKAWQDAYGRYVYTPIMTHPSLNRYFKTVIFNVTHNNAHEDDILQESLVNGYRYFHKFYGQNPETGPFFSWLVGITRRVALNFVQRTPYGNHTIREKPAYSLDAPVTHGPDTPAWLDQLRTLRPLAHAIEDTGAGGTRAVEDSDSETLLVRQLEQALNRKQFALVRGVVWDELTLTGYARLHGETDKAVYSQWDRVKKKLAGVLEQYAGLQPAGYITPASEHEKRKSRNATEHEGDSTLAV